MSWMCPNCNTEISDTDSENNRITKCRCGYECSPEEKDTLQKPLDRDIDSTQSSDTNVKHDKTKHIAPSRQIGEGLNKSNRGSAKSLLSDGHIAFEENNIDKARQVFTELMTEFPGTIEADAAYKHMDSMKASVKFPSYKRGLKENTKTAKVNVAESKKEDSGCWNTIVTFIGCSILLAVFFRACTSG